MKARFSHTAALLLAIASITALPACSGGSGSAASTQKTAMDSNLVNPMVGDIYAAEISHFSGAEFSTSSNRPGASRDIEKAYGLMKVIEVQPDRIVLNTEEGAWPQPRGARNDLRGDLVDISWDSEEKVVIMRSELPKLWSDETIFETRRMKP